MQTSEETKLILGLLSLKGIGPGTVRSLRSLPNFAELSIEQITLASKEDVRILSFFDAAYPALLTSSKDDPCVIYVKGNLSETPNHSVAVIGTREPTQQGRLMAKRITVAVMAHGLQTVTPDANRDLAERIVNSGGALVSQYPFGQKPSPYLFLQRDKTQAAMARGVVMIQSSVEGGSLHASRASITNDRWLAVPVINEEGAQKFGANAILTSGTRLEKAELLTCDEKRVENCITLASEADYSRLLL